jgi:hypothetical protein
MGRSRVRPTIARLVELFTPAVGEVGNVFRGPFVTGDVKPTVWVGYDGDPEGDFKTADPTQEWAGIGNFARDEEFDIPCAATALIGDQEIDLAWDAVDALLAIVENTLRADPSLGQTPTPYTAEYRPGPVHTEPTSTGWQVRAVFAVHVKTRLYTN